MNVRETLNYLKWGEKCDFAEVLVEYVHRGAPGDTRTVRGDEIVEIGRSSFDLAGASIPYHRVVRITHNGRILFQRHADRGNISGKEK